LRFAGNVQLTLIQTDKLKQYLKETHQEVGRLTIHSLRHTFASHLVMAGVNLYTVAKLLGHSSVRCHRDVCSPGARSLQASVERFEY